MKKIMMVLMLSAGLIAFQQADAQRLKVNTNQSQQPAWGPKGYDYVSYYFLPEMNAYYYVPDKQFIYQENGNWKFSNRLPASYRNYNLHSAKKVVVNDPKPYTNHQYYASRYGAARTGNEVVSVRNAKSESWNANRNRSVRTENMRLEQKRREYRHDGDKIKRPKKHPGRGNAYGHL